MSKKPTRYQQEINRIKRQIKALEKKGYRIEAFELPTTTREARAIKPEAIRQSAFKIDTTTNNKISYKKAKKLPTIGRRKRLYDTDTEDDEQRYEITPSKVKEIKQKEKKSKSKGKSKKSKENNNPFGIRKRRSDYGSKKPKKSKEEEQFYPKEEDIIIDNLLYLISKLENADVTWGVGKRGQVRRRDNEEITLSEAVRQSLLDIINNEIREVGKNEVAKRLNSRASKEELGAIVDTMLHGYSDDIRPSYVKIVSFITEGMLSEQALAYWSEIDNALDSNYGEI